MRAGELQPEAHLHARCRGSSQLDGAREVTHRALPVTDLAVEPAQRGGELQFQVAQIRAPRDVEGLVERVERG
jgi:hypothetical protein